MSDKKAIAAKRACLRRENRKYTRDFKLIPERLWPAGFSTIRKSLIQLWRSSEFLVQVFAEGNGIRRLSINRTDINPDGNWKADISWEELQWIKNQLGYSKACAVEIFPPEVEEVNVANMRHLWVLSEEPAFMWRSA